MKQVFHFCTGKIDKYASLLTDGFDKPAGQYGFPVIKHCAIVFRQAYVAFETVGMNQVERTQQTVQKGSDKQMLLCISEIIERK